MLRADVHLSDHKKDWHLQCQCNSHVLLAHTHNTCRTKEDLHMTLRLLHDKRSINDKPITQTGTDPNSSSGSQLEWQSATVGTRDHNSPCVAHRQNNVCRLQPCSICNMLSCVASRSFLRSGNGTESGSAPCSIMTQLLEHLRILLLAGSTFACCCSLFARRNLGTDTCVVEQQRQRCRQDTRDTGGPLQWHAQ